MPVRTTRKCSTFAFFCALLWPMPRPGVLMRSNENYRRDVVSAGWNSSDWHHPPPLPSGWSASLGAWPANTRRF